MGGTRCPPNCRCRQAGTIWKRIKKLPRRLGGNTHPSALARHPPQSEGPKTRSGRPQLGRLPKHPPAWRTRATVELPARRTKLTAMLGGPPRRSNQYRPMRQMCSSVDLSLRVKKSA